jgi:hypothetical protein
MSQRGTTIAKKQTKNRTSLYSRTEGDDELDTRLMEEALKARIALLRSEHLEMLAFRKTIRSTREQDCSPSEEIQLQDETPRS